MTLMCERFGTGALWVCEDQQAGRWRKVLMGDDPGAANVGYISLGFYPVNHPLKYKVWDEDFEEGKPH